MVDHVPEAGFGNIPPQNVWRCHKSRGGNHSADASKMVDAFPKITLAFTAARCTIARTKQRSWMIDGRSRGPRTRGLVGQSIRPC